MSRPRVAFWQITGLSGALTSLLSDSFVAQVFGAANFIAAAIVLLTAKAES